MRYHPGRICLLSLGGAMSIFIISTAIPGNNIEYIHAVKLTLTLSLISLYHGIKWVRVTQNINRFRFQNNAEITQPINSQPII